MLDAVSLPELILLEISILLAAGSIFLRWKLVRARRECVSLTNQLSILRRREVTTFFSRELVHTRDIARRESPRSPEAARLLQLRQQWLEAEQNALTAEGEEKSDYAAIERAAQLLLQTVDGQGAATITRRHRSGTSPAPTGENPRELLSRSKTVIELQKEIIAKLKASAATAADSQSAGATAAIWGDVLALAHQNTEQQHSSLVKLERGLDAAQEQYRHASNELQPAKATGQTASHSAQSLLIIQSPDSINVESAKAFLDEMEEAYRESAVELRLMRDTNARQRKLILDLEKQLTTLKSRPEEQQASEELLKSLKAQLREYESCTATLELETEHLRAKLKVLNGLIANAKQNEQVNIADKLSSVQQESDTAAHILDRQQQAEEQLALIARADTIERAVPAILHWLCLHGLDCAVYIRAALGKQYWCSTDGKPVEGCVRQLLQSMGPGADSFWTETKNGPIFMGSVLRICVQNPGWEASDRYEAKDDLTMPLQIIDALLRPLTNGRKSDRPAAARLDQHLDAAMTQHKFLLDETVRIADQLYEELPQYLQNLQLTRIQKECLDGMVEDFKSDLHLLARAGGSVEHALKTATLALSRQPTT